MEIGSIGRRIAQIRTQRGLSQRAFAEQLGISSGYLSEVENGKKHPGSEVLFALRRCFDVDLNWLVAGGGQIPVMVSDVTGVTGRSKRAPPPSVVVVKASAGGGDLQAKRMIAAAYADYESHESDMCDVVSQPDYVCDGPNPGRTDLLRMFCDCYSKYGPRSVGLPESIMQTYPMLRPGDIVDALTVTNREQPSARWIQPANTDWNAWLSCAAELAANGVTPEDVLTKFRPAGAGDVTASVSPAPEVTNIMF